MRPSLLAEGKVCEIAFILGLLSAVVVLTRIG